MTTKPKRFAAHYLFGPADGLKSYILASNDNRPPNVSGRELYSLVEPFSPLGIHYLSIRKPERVRMGVYVLDKFSSKKAGILQYRFVRMISYKDFVDKFGEE